MGKALENIIYSESYEAQEDLSAKQYYFVAKHATDNQVDLAVAGEGFGILQNKPDEGQAAEVAHLGLSKCIASGALTPGTHLTSDANGKAVAATTDDEVCAVAVTTGAADELFTVFIFPPYVSP